jgi:hypothetical protein
MARTIATIADGIKTAFMADTTLQAAYGFADTDSFDDVFSTVSIERIIIYIIASAMWALENIFDTFSEDITTKINDEIVTSIMWYYNKALAFQYGDDLIFDSDTYSFGYAAINTTNQIVQYVAVREVVDSTTNVTELKIYYSGANKAALTTAQQTAFEAYMRSIGAAGTHYIFVSQNPDALGLSLNIYYDPLILDSTGKKISDSSYPVTDAINTYLNNLKYGGTFYASALIDALQATDGVKDVELTSTYWNGSAAARRKIDAASGAFSYDATNSSITYVLDS